MNNPGASLVWKHIAGETRDNVILVIAVVGLVILSSAGFVIGLNVGLSLGWIVVVVGIALVAGWKGAGLGPTIGSLWIIGLWWFVFPPLEGYVSGEWADASRYTHPRMQGFAYGTARAELIGGIEYGVKYGLLLAIIVGTLGYLSGAIICWITTRL